MMKKNVEIKFNYGKVMTFLCTHLLSIIRRSIKFDVRKKKFRVILLSSSDFSPNALKIYLYLIIIKNKNTK